MNSCGLRLNDVKIDALLSSSSSGCVSLSLSAARKCGLTSTEATLSHVTATVQGEPIDLELVHVVDRDYPHLFLPSEWTRKYVKTLGYEEATFRANGASVTVPLFSSEEYRDDYNGRCYYCDKGWKSKKPTPMSREAEAEGAKELLKRIPSGAIVCFADGACEGNPGPMGAGALLWIPRTGGDHDRKEESLALGMGTNNIAELKAIELVLDMLDRYEDRASLGGARVDIMSDSQYAQGVLTLGRKAHVNVDLVDKIKDKLARRDRKNIVRVHWVAGHSGVEGNERADELARRGVRDSRDSAHNKTQSSRYSSSTSSSSTHSSSQSASSSESKDRRVDDDVRCVYVGNVPYKSTEKDLEKIFADCGAVDQTTIVRDRYSGRSKGYAFVEFASAKALSRALKLDGTEFMGRRITVSEKRSNSPVRDSNGDPKRRQRSRSPAGRGPDFSRKDENSRGDRNDSSTSRNGARHEPRSERYDDRQRDNRQRDDRQRDYRR